MGPSGRGETQTCSEESLRSLGLSSDTQEPLKTPVSVEVVSLTLNLEVRSSRRLNGKPDKGLKANRKRTFLCSKRTDNHFLSGRSELFMSKHYDDNYSLIIAFTLWDDFKAISDRLDAIIYKQLLAIRREIKQ